MLTIEENERLTRVGPGTPMGNMMRRYWHPITSVEDLEREEVMPVRLLGENLVLFKTNTGKLGLVQERCPHRSTSLAYGIPDDDGLRCPYHGWMFDSQGACIEQPFDDIENPDSTFKDKIRVDAYPVEALGGLVWVYMGPLPAPLLPRWDLLVRDDLDRSIGFTELPCNWLQCMENSLDPVHFEWLHANLINYVGKKAGKKPVMFPARHLKIAFDRFQYGIYKRRLLEGDDPETSEDWKVGHPVLFPNTLSVGTSFQIRVPVDDTTTLHLLYRTDPVADPANPKLKIYDLPYKHENGRYVLETVIGTDMMAWVTQGDLTPRQHERLGVSDRGIILYRQMLSEGIAAVERGEDPPALVRDPAVNHPWINIARERASLTAYNLKDSGTRGTIVQPQDLGKPREVVGAAARP